MIVVEHPYPADKMKELHRWVTEFEYQMSDDTSPKTLEDVTEKYRSTELSYGIWKNGAIAGNVWAEPIGDGQFLGHLVFDKDLMSVHEKIQATKAAAKQLFNCGARKLLWQTFADNRAYIAFMRRVGAKVEGTLRKTTKRNGEYVDGVLLGLFAEEIR
jgi:hypothetical protein